MAGGRCPVNGGNGGRAPWGGARPANRRAEVPGRLWGASGRPMVAQHTLWCRSTTLECACPRVRAPPLLRPGIASGVALRLCRRSLHGSFPLRCRSGRVPRRRSPLRSRLGGCLSGRDRPYRRRGARLGLRARRYRSRPGRFDHPRRRLSLEGARAGIGAGRIYRGSLGRVGRGRSPIPWRPPWFRRSRSTSQGSAVRFPLGHSGACVRRAAFLPSPGTTARHRLGWTCDPLARRPGPRRFELFRTALVCLDSWVRTVLLARLRSRGRRRNRGTVLAATLGTRRRRCPMIPLADLASLEGPGPGIGDRHRRVVRGVRSTAFYAFWTRRRGFP